MPVSKTKYTKGSLKGYSPTIRTKDASLKGKHIRQRKGTVYEYKLENKCGAWDDYKKKFSTPKKDIKCVSKPKEGCEKGVGCGPTKGRCEKEH